MKINTHINKVHIKNNNKKLRNWFSFSHVGEKLRWNLFTSITSVLQISTDVMWWSFFEHFFFLLCLWCVSLVARRYCVYVFIFFFSFSSLFFLLFSFIFTFRSLSFACAIAVVSISVCATEMDTECVWIVWKSSVNKEKWVKSLF